MKILKSCVSVLMLIVLLFVSIVPAFAVESPYDILLEKGVPVELLDSLTDDIILKIYNEIGTKSISSVTSKTVYLTEKNGDIQPAGEISESSLYLEISGIKLTDSGKLTGVVFILVWEWAPDKPVFRQTDSITVNWDASVFNYKGDSFCSVSLYRYTHSPQEWQVFREYTRPAESNQGGLGFYSPLAGDLPNYSISNSGLAIFALNMNSPEKDKDTRSTSINVNYVHNRSIVIPSLSFTKTGLSVSVGTIIGLTDYASDTVNISY